MKKIPLSNSGKFTLVDDEDYEYLNQWKWHIGTGGYVRRSTHINHPTEGRKSVGYFMHKVILPTEKGIDTDHINRDKLDNRRVNLRRATRRQNMANVIRKNSLGFRGVYQKGVNSFHSQIWHNRKRLYLGAFRTAEEAARAYDTKARELFGEFTITNFKEQE